MWYDYKCLCSLLFWLKVVEMCWSQQLYDAMIHVYNSGMADYTTPLLELLLQLRGSLKKGRSISGEYKLENTTLKYLMVPHLLSLCRSLYEYWQ